MATHDYVIANASGSAVRQDLNNALQAIVSNNSSSTAPGTTYAHMLWLDTTNDILKIRNAANDAWIDWITQAGTPLIPDGTVGAPGLAFASETDSGLYRIAANTLGVATSGTERIEIADGGIVINESGADFNVRIEGDNDANLVYVDAGNGRLGVGTGSPAQKLHIVGATGGDVGIRIENNDGFAELEVDGDELNYNADAHVFNNQSDGTEFARIDTAGRLLVGTASNFNRGDIQAVNAGGGELLLARNDTTVAANDDIGHIFFSSNDSGTGVETCASITCLAAVDHGTNSSPTYLTFSTTPTSSNTATERMRIHNSGEVTFGTTSTDMTNATTGGGCVLSDGGGDFAADNQVVANFNRTNGDDASVITIRHDGDLEGSITVNGSTVSFNGGHLSRWSQLPGGAKRTEILRGSVLSNLDEMCEWGEEDNEQLNRVKVSDVEGDPNVAGVFQMWDDDDDTYTNDFYIAMTGDFVIRIAQGTTVARGDLLMSAGDGTAKPQDDDIIRSKTIAKVTSTVVSRTHADGSYCVPCVLMAC